LALVADPVAAQTDAIASPDALSLTATYDRILQTGASRARNRDFGGGAVEVASEQFVVGAGYTVFEDGSFATGSLGYRLVDDSETLTRATLGVGVQKAYGIGDGEVTFLPALRLSTRLGTDGTLDVLAFGSGVYTVPTGDSRVTSALIVSSGVTFAYGAGPTRALLSPALTYNTASRVEAQLVFGLRGGIVTQL
ncbi:MAG: hypothetical protein AAFQ43_13830, partial [Bacteroidota bacterium]